MEIWTTRILNRSFSHIWKMIDGLDIIGIAMQNALLEKKKKEKKDGMMRITCAKSEKVPHKHSTIVCI